MFVANDILFKKYDPYLLISGMDTISDLTDKKVSICEKGCKTIYHYYITKYLC